MYIYIYIYIYMYVYVCVCVCVCSLYSLLHVDFDSIYSSQAQKEVWAKRPEIKSELYRERERENSRIIING